MKMMRHALLGLCFLLGALGGALAQDNKWDKPLDLKPLVPPVFPLPPSSQLNPGTVGGAQSPYTTAPLQNQQTPGQSSSQPAPGIRLSIPSRSER